MIKSKEAGSNPCGDEILLCCCETASGPPAEICSIQAKAVKTSLFLFRGENNLSRAQRLILDSGLIQTKQSLLIWWTNLTPGGQTSHSHQLIIFIGTWRMKDISCLLSWSASSQPPHPADQIYSKQWGKLEMKMISKEITYICTNQYTIMTEITQDLQIQCSRSALYVQMVCICGDLPTQHALRAGNWTTSLVYRHILGTSFL